MKVLSVVALCLLVAAANGQGSASVQGSASIQGTANVQAPSTAGIQGSAFIAPMRTGLNNLRVNLANSLTQAREGINNIISQAGSMATTGINQGKQAVADIIAVKKNAAGQITTAFQNGLNTGAKMASSMPFGASLSTGMTTAGNLVGQLGNQAQSNIASIGDMKSQGLEAFASAVPGFVSAAKEGASQAFNEMQSAGARGFDMAGQSLDTVQNGIDTAINSFQGAIPSSMTGSFSATGSGATVQAAAA